MSLPIEQYALVGDFHTAALVGSNGSIDWLCFPRFDSGACFASLLGGPERGRWMIAPASPAARVTRRYRDGTLILETDFLTATGRVRIIDFMPLSDHRWDVIRIVEGLEGTVDLRMELVVRFDYGSIVPWVRRVDGVLLMTAGPDTLELTSSVKISGENLKSVAKFRVAARERLPFVLNYRPSHWPSSKPLDPEECLSITERRWREWSDASNYRGRWQGAVKRSLITLKALTYQPTGGMIAAPTTSLPEQPGGVRNWDYRFCWLRDATFTLNALLLAGYHEEAIAWRAWLLRAVAGSPTDLRILYSVTGARRLEEITLPWLTGYAGSAPVRTGNAAATQRQLDVYGEVLDTLHLGHLAGLPSDREARGMVVALLEFLESHWHEPDQGLWEMRGPPRHFTHSKIMAWVAFDRAIKGAERGHLKGPVARWRRERRAIHAEVCTKGYDGRRKTFVQSYDSAHLDASLLLIPQLGFLPAHDPRVRGTIRAIERTLLVDGLVMRYSTDAKVDALPAGEGAFLPCSFWLADAYFLAGRQQEAEALFTRLLGLGNDVGLYAEEYDPRARRQLGNFPQALTHMSLINTARLLPMTPDDARGAAARGERPHAAARHHRRSRAKLAREARAAEAPLRKERTVPRRSARAGRGGAPADRARGVGEPGKADKKTGPTGAVRAGQRARAGLGHPSSAAADAVRRAKRGARRKRRRAAD